MIFVRITLLVVGVQGIVYTQVTPGFQTAVAFLSGAALGVYTVMGERR